MTVIKDLRIAYNGSASQIDALIAFGNTITLYEVKNYEGEYIQLPGQFRKLKDSNRPRDCLPL
ncbi:MAG: nuclease-related domain-containing protein [Alkalibacterium sp.]|nr:nuclease-related domain-containing protein [Alkalibacterium sp.]